MSSDSTKPLVFISYAHLDEPEKPRGEAVQWLSFVMGFLKPGEKGRRYTVWIDRLMPGGADWSPEIEAKVRACDIFVLLVSTHSTGSDYILDKEVPIVRERRRNGETVHLYPLLLDWTPDVGLDQVRDKNLRPRDGKPFSSLSSSERSRAMAEAANEIAGFAKEIEGAKAEAAAMSEFLKLPFGVARSETKDLIVSGMKIERIAPAARVEQAAPFVDITGLPETGYERLVGRDEELRRLDQAWSDDKTNILSLIAEGGAGKSALVNEWLTRLQADGYRGATCVLGWSFYSQGSKERATAADAFLDWALDKLGVKIESTSATAKGDAIAEALMARRALLMLDGVEPLQHGPGPQPGQLKDQGLRALLRRVAAAPTSADHSVIVLTSRVAVADIQRFKDGAAPVVDVERLSDEAGAELLRDNDVWGIDRELRAASRDFGGHPLALTLLASLLKETQNGDVRRRDHIGGLIADPDNPRHDQARRVMESYEKEWLAGQPILLAILHCVGLFDRPASGDCLEALRAEPAISRLTDALVDLSDDQWGHAVARLREVRLLSPRDPFDPQALDAHPLVREWFGDRLKHTNEAAWKEAHSRLYDHLRDTTQEGQTPTLADLAPLYHAIGHGCRAGRQKHALDEVYWRRICRVTESYSDKKLGAVGSDLAAIAWFFDRPYEVPSAVLPPSDQAWVLSEASAGLRALGRLQEALPAMRVGLQMREDADDWRNAAIEASNLSETQLLGGEIAAAVSTAKRAVDFADIADEVLIITSARADHAVALHAAGLQEEAERVFAEANGLKKKWRPDYPLLHSLGGYQYCDVLLSRGQASEASERASQTLEWVRPQGWVLDIGLDTLTLGRAHLGLALQRLVDEDSAEIANDDVRIAALRLDEAVELMRASGQNEHLPRSLLARVAFRRAIGDWNGAESDLNEAKEIAEPGLMRLYWCDCALESARLALAQRETFAPLAGLIEPSPPPPASPDAGTTASLKDEARKQLDIARKLIAECGYHRRDAELAELDAVIAGRRRFADLPPRV
jgi:hypothetical protein